MCELVPTEIHCPATPKSVVPKMWSSKCGPLNDAPGDGNTPPGRYQGGRGAAAAESDGPRGSLSHRYDSMTLHVTEAA